MFNVCIIHASRLNYVLNYYHNTNYEEEEKAFHVKFLHGGLILCLERRY